MTRLRWSGWDPFGPLRYVQREMERLIDRTLSGEGRRVGGGSYPPVNVFDGANDMIVQLELPGVEQDDIDLSITGETLTIKGVKKGSAQESEDIRYQRRERWTGEFNRTVVLPEQVQAEAVDARLTNGVLTVRLPKAETARPRRIQVQ